ncbi:hypothetical protein [Acuticoccus kandeliae]|uniref:hypothetical protein n=1 Tax=Acuticoccus kandeliae TaxID=2073160 RepID=UPI000D3EE130|nr:hypothetical protein [Acuticoccus kandeliae]
MRAILSTTLIALTLATPAIAATLSPTAEKILAAVRSQNDVNAICKDRGALKSAVQSATRSLMNSGAIQGMPRSDAQAAGKYIADNCGQL